MKYGAAVIGCGDMGNAHAAAWAERPDARVVAVYDPDEARAERMAAARGAKRCSSYREAIEQSGVNIVSVCTPVFLHREVACCAAAAGRHILCEKPIALTAEQADEMIVAAERGGVKLAVSYQYRAFSRSRRIRELVQGNEFGGPVFYRFMDVREVRPKLAMHRKSMNGGPLIDMAGHWFDLVRYYTSSEPVRVFARGQVFATGKKRVAGIDDLAVDAAEIQVEMANGHVLSAFVNWGMPEGFSGFSEERVTGPAAAAWTENGKVVFRRADSTTTFDAPGDPRGPAARITDLIAAIENDRAPEVSGADGKAALRVSLAALESIATGAVVKL